MKKSYFTWSGPRIKNYCHWPHITLLSFFGNLCCCCLFWLFLNGHTFFFSSPIHLLPSLQLVLTAKCWRLSAATSFLFIWKSIPISIWVKSLRTSYLWPITPTRVKWPFSETWFGTVITATSSRSDDFHYSQSLFFNRDLLKPLAYFPFPAQVWPFYSLSSLKLLSIIPFSLWPTLFQCPSLSGLTISTPVRLSSFSVLSSSKISSQMK